MSAIGSDAFPDVASASASAAAVKVALVVLDGLFFLVFFMITSSR
jgi:hypothetical protein